MCVCVCVLWIFIRSNLKEHNNNNNNNVTDNYNKREVRCPRFKTDSIKQQEKKINPRPNKYEVLQYKVTKL